MADLYFAVGQTKRITQQFSINGAPSAVTAPTATETSPSGTITSLAAPTLQNSGTDPSYYLDYTPSGAAGVYLVKFKTTDATADNPIWTWINEVGALDVNVSTIAANAITAAAIATDAIDNDAIAANAVTELQSGLATAAALATAQASIDDLPTNAELVTSQAAADDATLAAIAALNNLSAAAAADAVWDEALAGHAAVGSTGEALADAAAGGGLDAAGVRAAIGLASANLDTQLADLPTVAELATSQAAADDATLAAIAALNNLSQANIRTAVGLASANLDTQLADLPTNAELATSQASADDATLAAITAATSPLATAAALDAVDNFVDTEVGLIKAVTDKLDTALELDGAVYRLTTNALEQAPTGAGGGLDAAQTRAALGMAAADLDTQLAALPQTGDLSTASENAAAVLDELLSGHVIAGSVGKAVADAAAGGGLDAAQTRAALGMAAANLDTQLAALPTASENANAVLDGAAASHNVALSIGEKINAAGSSADPLLNLVPGAYVAGTAGYNLGYIDDIKVKTDTIGASSVTVTSPVTSANTLELVQGDDYLAADSRQLDFTYTGQPAFTAATSVKLRFSIGTAVALELTGAVQSATTVRFQPTAVQTATLPSGTVQFEVEITLSNGHIITPTPLSSGRATVRAQAT